jgi:hypothetical protein
LHLKGRFHRLFPFHNQQNTMKNEATTTMTTFPIRRYYLLLLVALLCTEGCRALASPVSAAKGQSPADQKNASKKWSPLSILTKNTSTQWTRDIAIGYRRRVAADPSFPLKSLTEILVAASTQFTAEWGRRGRDQLLPQFDFVFAGILTAVYGKYAAMWKVSQTTASKNGDQVLEETASSLSSASSLNGKETAPQKDASAPTNAFQPYLLDGVTRPTFSQRLQSLILPVGPLFRAGFCASLIGYSFTAIMIAMRSWLVRVFLKRPYS